VVEVRLDCDGDALLYRVEPRGPACHTGEESCFYTTLYGGEEAESADLGRTLNRLAGTIAERRREMPEGSYTAKLLDRGTGYAAQKVGEEAVEVVIAALRDDRLAEETADLLYHLLVLLEERGVSPDEVGRVLDARHG
jgi:phosphoribosyl-ATP pyrophosphohydrolase/phosphoribosyl-AMP cyclohydrolase